MKIRSDCHHPSVPLAVAAATGAVLALATPLARAETALAGDLDYALPIDSRAESGGGFGFRLGHQLHVPGIAITPELAFSYVGLSGDFGPSVYRGTAGARLGIGEILRPGVFGHLGVGHARIDVPGGEASHTAFTYDAGLFLDLTLLPILNVGVHAGYNHLNGGDDGDALAWASLGAHAALIF